MPFLHGGLFGKHLRQLGRVPHGELKEDFVARGVCGAQDVSMPERMGAMCTWIQEVLAEAGRERWASVFRITSVVYDDLYRTPLFEKPVWYRPDQPDPVPLFAR